jgi:hypothetical protein
MVQKIKNAKNRYHMFVDDKITEIFCKCDEFYKLFVVELRKHQVEEGCTRTKRKYHRDGNLSIPEVMTILIMFHNSGYKYLKHFYLNEIAKNRGDLFPKTVSYNRFVELQKEAMLPLAVMLKKKLLSQCTGISFADSTPLRVCKNQRIGQHKVFRGLAQRGQCSMGWFYGFKLHLICNEKGGLINFMLTAGNVDDRKPLENKSFVKDLCGKLFADRGYISKTLFATLFVDGIHLVTKLKKGMKGGLQSIEDMLLLRKRAIIETVNDELKNIAQIEHSRHRSVSNFLSNGFAALSAYCFLPKKPSIRVEFCNDANNRQLALF